MIDKFKSKPETSSLKKKKGKNPPEKKKKFSHATIFVIVNIVLSVVIF